ncbi:hypothetical protein JCM11641_000916 [Rhodosporidiobolus odoratus]
MSRNTMNMLFPGRTTAGISNTAEGDRVVASSRRPDGTYRKEIKIRPGFTPQEDVVLYRSRGAVESEHRKAVKGAVPGLTPPGLSTQVQVQAGTSGMSKAQKKNAKRKEKRQEEELKTEHEVGVATAGDRPRKDARETPDEWDAEESGKEEGLSPFSPPVPPVPPVMAISDATSSVGEAEKRARTLRKKLRQAEELRTRPLRDLSTSEQDKVNKIIELETELALLKV